MPNPARACVECRSRKLKCDRLHPSCSTCRRSRKLCDYQTTSRSPLTRRYLTQIEQELAEARALLQERDRHPDSSSQVSTQGNADSHVESEPLSHSPINLAEGQNASRQPSKQEHVARCALLPPEVGPQSTTFEWDERRDVGRRDVGDIEKSRSRSTNGSARGGYFGIASTKAFLRITGRQDDTYPNPVFTQIPTTTPSQMQLSLLADHIDAYFARFHPIYPIIHESTFRAQMMELVDRPSDDIWQMLLYAVAAIGAFSVSTGQTDVDRALFEVAKARFSNEMMEVGNIALVQALTLMSVYLRKRYKPNSSYNYLGLANRVAMGIGLYKEFSTSTSAPFFRETRRRLWWCLYTLNLEDSIAYSRPQDFPQTGIELEYPLNIQDLDLNPNTTSVTAEANNTTLYSCLKFGAIFYFSVSKLYPRIISGPYPYARELLDFDDSTLRIWESSLPSFFRVKATQSPKYSFCHALLHWRCLNFRLLIYRPFVVWLYIMRYGNNPPKEPNDPAGVDTAIGRCLKTAEETITVISEFWDSNNKNAITGWYALNFIFTAALIPVLCLRYDSASAQGASWQSQVHTAMEVIESIVPFNNSASHNLDILKSLYRDCNFPESSHNPLAPGSTNVDLEDSIPMMPGIDHFFPVHNIL